jgi:hypothetical protein
MKQVNKDYIAIVRSNSGKLQYERIAIQKSEALRNRLIGMAHDERFTVSDMELCLKNSPLVSFMALPYFDVRQDVDFDIRMNWEMKLKVLELHNQKTKMGYLEAALELIEECDYRWNVLKLQAGSGEVFVRSQSTCESQYVNVRLKTGPSILVDSESVGEEYEGRLCFTVINKGLSVLPYRTLVELYDCSEDVLDSTRMFDAEHLQWDNYLRAIVSTANEVNERGVEYFREKVIEDGLFMAEKIELMCTDPESYLLWLEYDRDPVQIEYSEHEDSPKAAEKYDEELREMYELYVVGKKLTCAMFLGENLSEWATLGGEYAALAQVYPRIMKLGPAVLERMERLYEGLKDYDEESLLYLDYKRVLEDLRDWLKAR